MGFFNKAQDEQVKDIITNVFRPGDYVVTVYYGKKAGIIFHDKHLMEITSRLEKGYQEKGKGFIFAGAADTGAVRLAVNADITPIEIAGLLWDDIDCLQISVLETTTQEDIQRAAEDMLKDEKKYIVVSEIAGKIGRMWREAPAGI